MNVRRLLLYLSLMTGFVLINFNVVDVFAVSGGPGKEIVTVAPGEQYKGIVYTTNTEDAPLVVFVEQVDLEVNETGAWDYIKEPLPRGLLQWTKFDTSQEQTLDPNEKLEIEYTITIPENAAPGTYSTGFLIGTRSVEEQVMAGSGAFVGGRVLSQLYITVEGEFNEKLELESFNLNQNSFLKGEVVFDITLKNTGDVLIDPKGEITIFDQKDTQIKGVYPVLAKFDGEEVVTDRKDAIPVNLHRATIQPGVSQTIQVPWTHRKADLGEYKAKLNLYFGEKNEQIEATVTFNLVKNFNILDFKIDKYLNQNLPVNFSAKLQNIGTLPVTPNGYFAVNNVFGAQKMRVDLTKEELTMSGGEEKTLNNLMWDNGFALGYYKAILNLEVGGEIVTKSIGFWVINWWQGLIVIFVLMLIVFFAYKGTRGYLSIKKRLKTMEKKN